MTALFDNDHEEGDFSEYDSTVVDGGDLSIGSPGLNSSSYKMEATLNDTTAVYGQMDTSSATSDFRIGCRFDPNSAFASGEFTGFVYTNATASPWHSMIISCHHDGSNHQIRLRVWEDDGTTNDTSLYTITDAEHTIEVHMVRATNSGSSDGTAALIIDGVTKETLTGLDNYDIWALMNKVQFGGNIYVASDLDATIHLDDCRANNDGDALFPTGGSPDSLASLYGAITRRRSPIIRM